MADAGGDAEAWAGATDADAEPLRRSARADAAAEEHAPRRGSRAEKSLGLLSTRFMALFAGCSAGNKQLSLDAAAASLGVERRRMYDVVGILEACEVVVRKGKNAYTWYGVTRLPAALERLRQTVVRDGGGGCADADAEGGGSSGDEDEHASAGRSESRKDKSLGLLSQRFLQLFLSAESSVLSLEEAAQMLLGDGAADAARLKTKVRRLYDIANVLVSLQLIEKVHMDSRKPAFRWLGAALCTFAEMPAAAHTHAAAATAAAPSARRAHAPTKRAAPGASASQRKQPRRERASTGAEGLSFTELLTAGDDAAADAAAAAAVRRHRPSAAVAPVDAAADALPGELGAPAALPHPAFCYQSDALNGVFGQYVRALSSFAGAATQPRT